MQCVTSSLLTKYCPTWTARGAWACGSSRRGRSIACCAKSSQPTRAAAALKVERDTLRGSINHDQPLRIGRRDNGLGYYGHVDELRVFHRALAGPEVAQWYWSDRLRGILAVPADKREAASQAVLRDY